MLGTPTALAAERGLIRPQGAHHRWFCPDDDCPAGSFTGEDPRIAPPRGAMTDGADRWVTEQVGRLGRTVAEVARELGCDWHTVNSVVTPTAHRWSTTPAASAP